MEANNLTKTHNKNNKTVDRKKAELINNRIGQVLAITMLVTHRLKSHRINVNNLLRNKELMTLVAIYNHKMKEAVINRGKHRPQNK